LQVTQDRAQRVRLGDARFVLGGCPGIVRLDRNPFAAHQGLQREVPQRFGNRLFHRIVLRDDYRCHRLDLLRTPAAHTAAYASSLSQSTYCGGATAHALGHPRVLTPGHLALDGLDVDLVPPVVAEVEPVAEAVADLQAQRVEGRLIDTAYRRGWLVLLGFHGVRQEIAACLRVPRPPSAVVTVKVILTA